MFRSNYLYKLLLVILFAIFQRAIAQPPASTTAVVDSLNQSAFNLKKSNMSAALNDLYKSQNMSLQIGYRKGLAISYMNEAGIYQQQGFDKRAKVDYYQALELLTELKDTLNIAKVNQQLANLLVKENLKDSALKVATQSLNIFTKLKKFEDIINMKNAIGLIWLKLKQTKKGEILFNEALADSRKGKYLYGEKKALLNLGFTQSQYKNYDQSASYFKQSLAIDSVLKDKYGIAFNLSLISYFYADKNRFDSAFYFCEEAYKNAASIEAYDILNAIVHRLIDFSKRTGNKQLEIRWKDSSIAVLERQRVRDSENAAMLIDIIKRQQSLRLDRENAIIKAERVSREQFYIITVGTFIMIILAVLVVLVFINFQRQKFLGIELRKKNRQIEDHAAELRVLNTEISDQNKLLEADNKTKDKLLSIISHDLRNPLVNTKGILNLVNQGIVPDDQAKQLLIQLETQYMGTTSLLDNLLFWLRGQMQGKNLEKIKVNVAQIVKSLEEEHRMLLERKRVRFINKIVPGTDMNADKEMMRIVLRNLISNAIKFTSEGGEIEINAYKTEKETMVTIRDTGIGMDAISIEKIKAKQYYTTAGTLMEKGSGFGLMLCSDLIGRHDGRLEITSEPGIGSQFVIHIPS